MIISGKIESLTSSPSKQTKKVDTDNSFDMNLPEHEDEFEAPDPTINNNKSSNDILN